METYIVRINGTEYEVEIEKKAGTGSSGPGTISAPQPSAAAQHGTAGGSSGGQNGNAGTSGTDAQNGGNASGASAGAAGEPVICGTAGKVWKIEKNPGDPVSKGDSVLILEAMKMEIPVVAPIDGTVSQITVQEGDAVASGQTVAFVE